MAKSNQPSVYYNVIIKNGKETARLANNGDLYIQDGTLVTKNGDTYLPESFYKGAKLNKRVVAKNADNPKQRWVLATDKELKKYNSLTKGLKKTFFGTLASARASLANAKMDTIQTYRATKAETEIVKVLKHGKIPSGLSTFSTNIKSAVVGVATGGSALFIGALGIGAMSATKGSSRAVASVLNSQIAWDRLCQHSVGMTGQEVIESLKLDNDTVQEFLQGRYKEQYDACIDQQTGQLDIDKFSQAVYECECGNSNEEIAELYKFIATASYTKIWEHNSGNLKNGDVENLVPDSWIDDQITASENAMNIHGYGEDFLFGNHIDNDNDPMHAAWVESKQTGTDTQLQAFVTTMVINDANGENVYSENNMGNFITRAFFKNRYIKNGGDASKIKEPEPGSDEKIDDVARFKEYFKNINLKDSNGNAFTDEQIDDMADSTVWHYAPQVYYHYLWQKIVDTAPLTDADRDSPDFTNLTEFVTNYAFVTDYDLVLDYSKMTYLNDGYNQIVQFKRLELESLEKEGKTTDIDGNSTDINGFPLSFWSDHSDLEQDDYNAYLAQDSSVTIDDLIIAMGSTEGTILAIGSKEREVYKEIDEKYDLGILEKDANGYYTGKVDTTQLANIPDDDKSSYIQKINEAQQQDYSITQNFVQAKAQYDNINSKDGDLTDGEQDVMEYINKNPTIAKDYADYQDSITPDDAGVSDTQTNNNTGLFVGIVAGIALAVIAVGYLLFRHKNNEQKADAPTEDVNTKGPTK